MATNPAMLDKLGLMLAAAMGAITLFADFQAGQFLFFPIFLLFLVSSVVVTKYGYSAKREMNLYEHERSWENVLANGLIPVIAAIAAPQIGWGAYIGSVAAVTADKFASELGVLGSEPISLLTFKKAKKGESGCISPFGTLMSFDGALLIGIATYILAGSANAWIIIQIGLVGLAGSIADSIAGVAEERGFGNKATTNFICALIGAILGWAFLI
jgi:uncharacterized protein (TIGR00297 family)